jgi:hypothetical protein
MATVLPNQSKVAAALLRVIIPCNELPAASIGKLNGGDIMTKSHRKVPLPILCGGTFRSPFRVDGVSVDEAGGIP